MSGNKIKLGVLQRFDLQDANRIQDYSYDYQERVLGELLGTARGCAQSFFVSERNTSSHYFKLGQFSFIGYALSNGEFRAYQAHYDPTDVANPSGTGEISYASVRSLVQTYLSSQGSLPPNPESASFVEGTHGQYYPFLWARIVEVEDQEEPRRFWDSIQNAETTQTVDTRIRYGVEFTFSRLAPSQGSGLAWVKVGQLREWGVSGGTVTSTANTLKPIMITDEVLYRTEDALLSQDFSSIHSGIAHSLNVLSLAMQQLSDNGVSDSSLAPAKKWYEQPRYSISGLATRIDDLFNITENRRQELEDSLQRATITYLYSRSAGASTVFFGKNDSENMFLTQGDMNYRFARDNGEVSGTGLNAMAPSNRQLTASNIVIQLPEALNGKRIHSCNGTFISPAHVGDLMASGIPGVVNTSFPMSYLRNLSDDASLVYSNFTYVREETFVDINHNEITAPALLFSIYPANVFNASDIRFAFQIELIIDAN